MFCQSLRGPVRSLALALCLFGLSIGLGASARADDYEEHYEHYKAALADQDLESAVVHARRAYLAAVRERGRSDPHTGVLAHNLGAVNLQLGRHRDATKALGEAIPIYQAAHGERSERLITPLRKLAAAHQALEEWNEAERHYVRALTIIEAERGRYDPSAAEVLLQLTAVANSLSAHTRVRSYGLRGLIIMMKQTDHPPIDLVHLHVAVAGAEIVLGDTPQANRHTERALEICEESLDSDSDYVIQVYEFAANLFEKTGKGSSSRKYRRKAKEAREAAGSG